MHVHQDLLLSQRWTGIVGLDIHSMARPALVARPDVVELNPNLVDENDIEKESFGQINIVVPYAVDEELSLHE